MTSPSLTDEQGRRWEVVDWGTDRIATRPDGSTTLRPGDLIVRRAPEGGQDERRRLTQLVADAVNNDRPIYDVVTDILAALAADRQRVARIAQETLLRSIGEHAGSAPWGALAHLQPRPWSQIERKAQR